MSRIVTSLWFASDVREAADFYVSLIPNSSIDRVTVLNADSPSGPTGSVSVIDFTLDGRAFSAMQAAGAEPFNHAASITVLCDDQAEIDRIWNAILKNGGTEVACGWIKDRWGLSWQVVPRVLLDMIADSNGAKSKAAAEAMMQMVKFEIEPLRRAFDAA